MRLKKLEKKQYLAIPANPTFQTYVSWDPQSGSFCAEITKENCASEGTCKVIGSPELPITCLSDFTAKIQSYARLDSDICFLLTRDQALSTEDTPTV